ncbi:MAG: hypothetical protein ACK47B_28575 [Armatimonadota bacterium]
MNLPGHPLKFDQEAATSDESLPAFLAPPPGAAPYHGFPLIPETCIDGWCYGAITEFIDPENYPAGCDSGDGFVQAPDGTRAGLVWWTECPEEIMEVCPPEPNRWGVWEVRFSRPVNSLEDLIFNFTQVLPLLQARYRAIFQAGDVEAPKEAQQR